MTKCYQASLHEPLLGRDGYHMSVFPAGTPLLFLYFTNNICLISVKDYFPWEDVVLIRVHI